MKIGLYSPYIDSFGGGERYVFTLASHWSQHHDVHVFWDSSADIKTAQARFNLDLSHVTIDTDIFKHANFIEKLAVTRSFDCMFFLSDGSIPTSLAKKNILHFQVPFAHVSVPFWKTALYKLIVCNSEFTKKFLDPKIVIQRLVIYPPVETELQKTGIKKNMILSVGRFGGIYNAKKYDILIEAFQKMYEENSLKNWRFALAGSLLDSDKDSLKHLKELAKGLPIEFYPNCPIETLRSLYEQAAIYWHAAGYGEEKPEHMEHFGITTVEAMNAGCVPISFNGGGQPEIVDEGKNGMLWNDSQEFVQKSLEVIQNEVLRSALSTEAIKKAKKFSVDKFTTAFDELLLKSK